MNPMFTYTPRPRAGIVIGEEERQKYAQHNPLFSQPASAWNPQQPPGAITTEEVRDRE